ncbi:acyltransferase family protein [Methylobacterium sp. WL116]|uniref:acyltransferase family protein n=1 Tax=Methylobacterium sp. WL116 TaxID=2603889 RepID=UPI0011CB020B|nr:acyltransferase family protein [Methylobacterium sp. WL116]TXM89385.1 acyltransferase family protein [Methylobacterium sp. WL116]
MSTIAAGDGTDRERRVDLDWLRIIAFAILIFYHVGLLYLPWPYHAKSSHRVPAIEPLMRLVNPWRLLLLFLISGCATRFLARRMPPGALLAGRSVRLLVPLVFGMLVIVPPQSYVQAVEQFAYRAGFLHFYVAEYLGGTRRLCRATCLALPTWNHLWFVLYLYAYTLVLIALTILLRPVRASVGAFVDRAAANGAFVVAPVLLLILARAALLPSFPPNDAFVGDWYAHSIYLAAFLLGFLMAGCDVAWKSLDRCRWPASILAAAVSAVAWPGHPADPSFGWTALLHRHETIAMPVYQWSVIIAMLAFGRRLLPRTDGPWRRYLTAAVFPFYLVHQTAIVLAAYALRDAGWSAAAEAAAIVSITVVSCLATFEIVRRSRWLRPLFGLRRVRTASPADAGGHFKPLANGSKPSIHPPDRSAPGKSDAP